MIEVLPKDTQNHTTDKPRTDLQRVCLRTFDGQHTDGKTGAQGGEKRLHDIVLAGTPACKPPHGEGLPPKRLGYISLATVLIAPIRSA